MKERPILFGGPMVRAIWEGRKTQTRRVVKPQPSGGGLEWVETSDGFAAWQDSCLNLDEHSEDGGPYQRVCPYGQPGDRLWVRETWFSPDYRAYGHTTGPTYYRSTDDPDEWPWHPSIYMPRWASRITLEVTGVRVERVQEISDGDVLAEGVAQINIDKYKKWLHENDVHGTAFFELWDSINGEKPGRSWDDNPLVWVIEFKRI